MPWEPNKLERERLDTLQRLKERGIETYPPRVQRTHTTTAAIAAFEAVEPPVGSDQPAPQIEVIVCGRIRSIRLSGKASFGHIEDGEGRLQLFVRQDAVGEETYDLFKRDLDLFDFVQAKGVMMRTRSGEISVQVNELKLIAKALSPLPVVKEQEVDGQVQKYGGFTDVEERYRQRYADLATNPEIREVFKTRAKIISSIRHFLDDENFLEVETPVLQPIYGGAAARPFITHHNQLDQDLFLRISFELYLKRLLVGMYDAVYEIGRDFRNEGVSFKHNTEFTMLEFYKAYIDYNGVMDLTERMLAYTAQRVFGSTKFSYQGQEVDFTPPFKRWKLRDAIRELSGIDYMDHPTAETLYEAMVAAGLEVAPGQTWGKLVDTLLSKCVEPTLIQPTFLLDYPRELSPFAKAYPGDPRHTERFEMYAAGFELCNAFTELNDPLDQEARFLEMGRLYADTDDEATPIDEDYLRAMRYGMPPCGGFGMGIDRLTMLFTDRDTIREVILYPHLRDK
ncbi:MAG: lysine--tRNA ligase [Anaerolineae bacterium]|nr:lysine--tRNA ligase [Anaerolineae bacterium]